jgi:hypothetical protein
MCAYWRVRLVVTPCRSPGCLKASHTASWAVASPPAGRLPGGEGSVCLLSGAKPGHRLRHRRRRRRFCSVGQRPAARGPRCGAARPDGVIAARRDTCHPHPASPPAHPAARARHKLTATLWSGGPATASTRHHSNLITQSSLPPSLHPPLPFPFSLQISCARVRS